MIRSSPGFFVRPSRILFVWKKGLFAEPSSANLGRWVSAWLQEEPLSLRTEREGDQEFPCLFCATLAHPFRSEGGVEYARLPSVGASGDISGELYWVVRVEARAPFARGRLVVQRRTPRVPEGFSSGCRGRSLGPSGSVPPYGGIPDRKSVV